MLKITRTVSPAHGATLKLEGKLVGPWVAALREAAGAGAGLRLDLSALSYADADGVRLLRELVEGGATVAASTGLIAGLLHTETP